MEESAICALLRSAVDTERVAGLMLLHHRIAHSPAAAHDVSAYRACVDDAFLERLLVSKAPIRRLALHVLSVEEVAQRVLTRDDAAKVRRTPACARTRGTAPAVVAYDVMYPLCVNARYVFVRSSMLCGGWWRGGAVWRLRTSCKSCCGSDTCVPCIVVALSCCMRSRVRIRIQSSS